MLWQHVILCKSYATESVPDSVCVMCCATWTLCVSCVVQLESQVAQQVTHTAKHTLSGVQLTQYDMLPQPRYQPSRTAP